MTPNTESLQRRALEMGITALGITPAVAYVGTESDIGARSAQGLFADLKFTMARPQNSCHPERQLDGAASVISAALSYWAPDSDVFSGTRQSHAGRIARYTRWDAYQRLVKLLDELASELRDAGYLARVLVDSNEHVDREAARRSGVGFYGKHTNIITRKHGSWVVLGTIITTAELQPTPEMRPGCGSCTRCIDACPTNAISPDGGVLDVRQCITYWTQSRHSVPDEIRNVMGNMVYGCDICQEVCPWNRGVEKRELNSDPISGLVDLAHWLSEDGRALIDQYSRFFVPRRDAKFLRRNALIALGNSGDPQAAALVAPFLASSDKMLVEQARWALTKLGGPIADAALSRNEEA